jgi:hypothetical protein
MKIGVDVLEHVRRVTTHQKVEVRVSIIPVGIPDGFRKGV